MARVKNYLVIIVLVLLLLSAIVVWYVIFYFESHQALRITFFDVGQGDAIFLETENTTQVLIDGGPSSAVLTKLGNAMPFWDHSIDLIILTHPHADHVTGLLEVLKRYDVGMVLESGVNYSTPEYSKWHRMLQEKHIPVVIASRGEHLQLSPHAALDILLPDHSYVGASPKNVHDAMVVAKLQYASTSVLLMGDAEKSLEYQLVFSGANLHADILKVGHHGSKTSTTEQFLRAVAPSYAIISVGRKNRYGHPYQEVLDRLQRFGVPMYRTDLNGDIGFVSDGARFLRVQK